MEDLGIEIRREHGALEQLNRKVNDALLRFKQT
jgi:hypothetical protein